MFNKTKFIAEIGSNHNQSLHRCYKLIDEAKRLGFYAVKFQLFKIDKLYSPDAKKLYKAALKKKNRELSIKFLPKLYNYCKRKKIKFGCTPFDLDSVKILKKFVDFYKIASYELNWDELLRACSLTNKPVILSTGMANFIEVRKAFNILKKNNKKISLLHCVSAYPANSKYCNLKSIQFLKKKFKCPVGWSDHTVDPLVIFNAVRNQKAEIIELHFDLDGSGWEEKEGNHHCWLTKDLEKMLFYINHEDDVEGKLYKKFSLVEKNERRYRADPSDGLRPLKEFRKFL
jgi:sialic acid synthase SpsE